MHGIHCFSSIYWHFTTLRPHVFVLVWYCNEFILFSWLLRLFYTIKKLAGLQCSFHEYYDNKKTQSHHASLSINASKKHFSFTW